MLTASWHVDSVLTLTIVVDFVDVDVVEVNLDAVMLTLTSMSTSWHGQDVNHRRDVDSDVVAVVVEAEAYEA